MNVNTHFHSLNILYWSIYVMKQFDHHYNNYYYLKDYITTAWPKININKKYDKLASKLSFKI